MPEFPTSEESKPPLCPPDGGAALALAVSIAAAAAWQPQLVQVVVLDGRVRRRRRHDVDVAPDGEAIVLYVPRPLQGIPPDETREARTGGMHRVPEFGCGAFAVGPRPTPPP